MSLLNALQIPHSYYDTTVCISTQNCKYYLFDVTFKKEVT